MLTKDDNFNKALVDKTKEVNVNEINRSGSNFNAQPKIERILTQMTEIQTQTQAELKKQVLSEDERELIKDLGWVNNC